MKNNLQIHRETIHRFMNTLQPGCDYLIIIADPPNMEEIHVAGTFKKEVTKEILGDLLLSLNDGTAHESRVKVTPRSQL